MAAPPSIVQIGDNNLRGMAISAIYWMTFTITANLALLRMYVRTKRHITGWNDYTICVALVDSFPVATPYDS